MDGKDEDQGGLLPSQGYVDSVVLTCLMPRPALLLLPPRLLMGSKVDAKREQQLWPMNPEHDACVSSKFMYNMKRQRASYDLC